MADSDPRTPQDLSDFAESLLKNLQDRFQAMSDQLTQRMEEMGSNIDGLQKDVSDLMTQAGIDKTDDVVAPNAGWTKDITGFEVGTGSADSAL